MNQTRREFIEALTVAGLGLVLARARAQGVAPAAYFKDAHACKAVGAEYLVAFPSEAEAVKAASFVVDPDVTRIAETIREDFAQGRTVKLKGWVLSQTEARICALASLTAA